ncbi:MAG: VanZ family protein [Candidatus Binataceae bacterium]
MSVRKIAVDLPLKSSSFEWLPIAIWAAVAFTFSTRLFSGANTLAIDAPILRWLFPAISSLCVGVMSLLVRKAAHFTEYAILFWLLVRGPLKGRPFAAMAICIGYALLDEGHQTFVPGRIASLHDVALDSTGAMFGGFLRVAISEIW